MGDEKRRRTLHTKLKSYLAEVENHAAQPLTIETATELMRKIDETWEKLETVQEKLESATADDEALKIQYSSGMDCDRTHRAARSKLRTLMETLLPKTATRTSSSSAPMASTAAVKLPAISLPHFEGSYAEWTSFKDLFVAAVANNKDLSNSQKLQYLKSSLRGEPLSIVDYLTTTDQNYTEAWRILNERYDNKREIIRSHVTRLIDYRVVKSENSRELQALVDNSMKCLRSLQVLGCPTEHWDDLTVFIVEKKLDPVTRREWAKRQTGTATPTLEDLIIFVNSHIRGLQAAGGSSSTHVPERRGDRQVRIHHAEAEVGQCPICKGSHFIQECKEFLSKNANERSGMVRKARLCYNCLRGDHIIKHCSSSRKCKKCGHKHHSFLHEDKGEKRIERTEKDVPSMAGYQVAADSRGLLMTAMVKVPDSHGRLQSCRVFIDNGSQGELITEACVNRLGLKREASRVMVKGVGDAKAGSTKGMVSAVLHSRYDNSQSLAASFLVMKKMTGRLPSARCKGDNWKHLEGLDLADDEWYKPGLVDIIIGTKLFHRVLLYKRIMGQSDDDPVAWETIFGWGVAGACPEESGAPITSYSVTIDPIDQQLRKFWEVEEPPKRRILSKEEKECEDHFVSTYSRDNAGRFVVQVPFHEDKKKKLGKSRDIALRRMQQVERRLNRNPALYEQYREFMKEYEELGHMTRVPPGECGEKLGRTNYLCHHFVQNESSSTTKLRVVFDGSAATSTGMSLNDTMKVGATMQDDLYDHLLKFRFFPIVLKCDMAKMLRQFKLPLEHADFHRILWRKTPCQPVVEFRLNTVTYGTASATNLATRCVVQLGNDCATEFPLASRALLNDTFVDDILSGGDTVENVLQLYRQLISAVGTAGLELRKFASNNKTVMDSIPEMMRETNQLVFQEDESVKALGIQWHPQSDQFKFKPIEFDNTKRLTKRLLLSELARVFDPLGLISCVTLRGKLLLQELWKLPVEWDDDVPVATEEKWLEYKTDLCYLTNLSIPRRMASSGAERYELCGFCDSSEVGYGGLIYLRSIFPNGTVAVKFVTSKTRVTPVRQVTLPRLELCSAVLLAELMTHVKECLKVDAEVRLWSDSTITLTWIAASPRRWKTFVANRVATIQELTMVDSWKHVAGVENPADLASRGCTVQDLCNSKMWWGGPEWLSQPLPPIFPKPTIVHQDLEERQVAVEIGLVKIEEPSLLLRFSSLRKLKRITAWYIRYLQYRISKKCVQGPLTAMELDNAFLLWVRHVQRQHFKDDYEKLKKTRQVNSKSKLRKLAPFIDKFDVIRVSGRLKNAGIAEEKMHQVILPASSHLTWLLIDHHHHVNFHSGFQLTYASLQRQYWILNGRDKVRHFVRNCVRCRRYRAKAAEQFMGDLPSARVTPARAFLHCGVDFAGPFQFKDVIGKVPKIYKGYMCLFVCLVTKAIHLEAATSLSTEAFLAALRRFVSRRGLCAHMYSDCGTNFVGAEREIRSFMMTSGAVSAAAKELGDKGITWHFNPPAAPHRGGLWEAGVKSAKGHLRRVMGNAALTFEQYSTVLAQIEAVLNSRPLYQMSPDPGDLQPLTPGHFLIGTEMNAVPDSTLLDIPSNRLSQFQRLQQQLQHFWRRWSRDYLNTLQQRNKWIWEKEDIKVGELVLLVEETPPGTWKMGRVLEVYPGADGRVRLVTVKTATSTLQRVVAKLVPLINDNNK